jgi:hypothetical protein
VLLLSDTLTTRPNKRINTAALKFVIILNVINRNIVYAVVRIAYVTVYVYTLKRYYTLSLQSLLSIPN